MSFIREEALRLIQQQIFTCSQSGAKVQADLDNKSGDILVTLFDTSIIDATPYRVRIRFRISYLESEAETTVARIKVSTIAHELNRTALFEVHRQTNEDVWERMHPWQFAYDGTCTVKAPPYGAGVSAQDAAPFAQLVVSRSNRLTLQQDAVERCLRMLIDEHEVSSKIRTELFLRRKKLREESLAFREELLLCAVSILSCGDLKTVLNLSPVLLKLLNRESKARKLSKVMLSDQTTFPSREAMICRPIEGVLDIASAWAPLSVGKGRSPNQLRAMSGRKPDRRPRVEWNVVLEPVPIVIQGLGVIGRRPENTQSFFDETLEKDVNLLIKTATDDPRGEKLVHISNKHVESIVPDSERDTLGKYCKELSSLCIIRTIHVPVPVPVVQVFYSDSSLHCFMERHHIMADMRHVENTAALREMDRSQFTLWDGTFCFDAVIDKSLKEPVHHDRPCSGETISRIASIYRPISDPIPRIARVSYRIAAGVFSTAQHVDLLQTWRSACLTRPKGIPKPWLEDIVFIDGLEDAHVPLGLDTESTVSLAMAIVDELATPVNLQKILHSSAYKFPSILTHEYLQEDGATSVEASRDYPVKIPENEANERYADEFNVQPVIEPIPVSTFAVLAGSKRAVQFKATVEKIKARNAMAHEIAADLSRKAYESARPVPWRFSDESTSMTAGMWYTMDPEEGGIARGDPRWNMSPLSDSAKHGWGSKLCDLIEQSVFQGNDSSKIPQKLLQACKNYSVAVCRRSAEIMSGSIELLLDGLMSSDNSTRSEAERAKDGIVASNAPNFIGQIASVMSSSTNVAHRSLAAVLIRRTFNKDIWGQFPHDMRAGMKSLLLSCFLGESDGGVRRKICHALADVAAVVAGEGAKDWPELLPAIFTLSSDANEARREASLFMFTALIDFTGDQIITPHTVQLQGILARLLVDPSLPVSVAALKAVCTMINTLDDDESRAGFKAFVPPMIKILEGTLTKAVNDSDEDLAQEVLKALIDVVQQHPEILRPHIEIVCHAMLVIVNHATFDEETRKLGLEFLLSLAEEAGATVRKIPALVDHVLSLGLRFLSSFEEDSSWVNRDDDPNSYTGEEDDAESGLIQAGVNAVMRLSNAIRGKIFLPAFFSPNHWPRMSTSPDWRERRAALLCYSLMLSGCKKEISPRIDEVVKQIIPFINDPHQRVRHSAIRCLGQMAEEFSDVDDFTASDSVGLVAESVVASAKDKSGGAAVAGGAMSRAKQSVSRTQNVKSIQDAAMDVMLPALMSCLGDQNAPRVRSIACVALNNLLDPSYTASEDVTPSAQQLLQSLFGIVRTLPEQFVVSRTNAIDVIGQIAQCLEEDFKPFFHLVSAALKNELAGDVSTPNKRAFRLSALNCLSIAIEAVGKEFSGVEAAETANFIIRTQAAGFPKDDESSFRIFSYALVRIATCLESDFEPYFHVALAPLLAKASAEVTVVFTNGGSDAPESAGLTSATLDVHDEKTTVSVDSQVLQDKETALRCLEVLISDMGVKVKAYWKIVDHLAPPLVAAINESFSNLREIGFEAIDSLLRCAIADTDDRTHGQRMMDLLVPAIAKRLSKEIQPEDASNLCCTAQEAFKLAWKSTQSRFNGPENEHLNGPPGESKYGRVVIRMDFMEGLFSAIQESFEGSASRRQDMVERTERNADVDEEDQARLEEELEDEDNILSNLTDIIGYCIKTHGRAILPPLSKGLGDYMISWLSKKDHIHVPMRASAICLIDDLIEFASPDSHVLLSQFIPVLIECTKPGNSLLLQPVVYGIGICAQHASGDQFTNAVPALVEGLRSVVGAPDARDGEVESATDNAVSALIKLARFRPTQVNAEHIMPSVLAYLPMKGDGIEARLIHSWLVDGILSSDPFWIGTGGANAPQALRSFARTLTLHLKRAAQAAAEENAEEDEESEEDTDPVLEEDSIAKMRSFATSTLKNSPQAAYVAGIMSTMSPKEVQALKSIGF